MPLEFDADFSGLDPDALEGGNLNKPGWYRCKLVQIEDDPKKDGVMVFTFRVTEGTHKNATVFDRLYDPRYAEDTAKAETSTKRMGLYAKRLGIWDGKNKRPHLDWVNALEKEVWLELAERTYKDRDGIPQRVCNVAFDGIYPIDDRRALEAVYGKGKVPPSAAANAAAHGQPYVAPPPPRDPPHRPAPPQQDPYAGL